MCLTHVRQTLRLPHPSGRELDPPPTPDCPLTCQLPLLKGPAESGPDPELPPGSPKSRIRAKTMSDQERGWWNPKTGSTWGWGQGGRKRPEATKPTLPDAHRGAGAAGAVSRTGRPWPLTSCLAFIPAALRKAGGGNRATEVFLGRGHGSGGHGAGRTRSSPFYFRGNGPKIGSTWNSSF